MELFNREFTSAVIGGVIVAVVSPCVSFFLPILWKKIEKIRIDRHNKRIYKKMGWDNMESVKIPEFFKLRQKH